MDSRPVVFVNARPLAGVQSGIARYTSSLYRAILADELAHVTFVSGRKLLASPPGPVTNRIDIPSLPFHPGWMLRELRRARDDRIWNALTANHDLDLYHETGMFVARHDPAVPAILTLYDLSLLRYPEFHPPDRVRMFERYFTSRLDSTAGFLAISEFVREEAVETLAIDPGRVFVTPLAADPVFTGQSTAQIQSLRSRLDLPEHYILYVGTAEPRKNLVQIVRALPRIDPSLPLVCAGPRGWLNDQLEIEIRRSGLGNRIHRVGHRSDSDLASLYSGATAMVYPSLYEGFGLPVLEAMACGCPVICSDRASLPEVAGDAAILVSPDDPEALAQAINSVIQDTELRKKLVQRGRARAAAFSWRDTARRTVEVFRKVTSR